MKKRCSVLMVATLLSISFFSSNQAQAEESNALGGSALLATTFGPLTTVAFISYLWCTKKDAAPTANVARFIEENKPAVIKDLSSGSGESLVTLAELTGVSEEKRFAFYVSLQERFATIFSDAYVPAMVAAQRIEAIAAM